MVLTITLNPLLERRLFFSNVEHGGVNRSSKEVYTAGGKGININRQLNKLNIPNSAFTFLGGNSGKILRHILSEEKINFSFVPTKNETRSATLVIEQEKSRTTHYFGPNTEYTASETEEFKGKLKKMIQNCSIVIFSGSSPSPLTDEIIIQGLEWADEFDKTSILDTYGGHLQKCIDKGPTILHNNIQEIESSLGISLSEEKSKFEFVKFLYEKKIKLIFLTDGENPFYAAKFDFLYKVYPPEIKSIDTAGSGDSFVAGIAYGLEKSLVFEEFLKIAVALGSANAAKWDTCNVELAEAEGLYDKINISPIGKKMKIIDDSPNY